MALTQPQRIQISGEQLDIPLKVQSALDTQAQLAGVKTELLKKDGSLQIFFDSYNTNINAYQTERRWVDGTTYSTVVNQDCIDSAQRISGNKFYPTDGSWTKFQPKLHSSSLGNPTTTSADSELEVFTKSLSSNGLTALLGFLLNGQTSAVSNDTLNAAYIPGSNTMTVTNGGQTPGKLIILEGGGFSGLFLVNTVVSKTLTVTEIIPPNGTLPTTTTTVKENITAFTNSERNTLTSVKYQNVLTQLTTKIISAVLLWETAIDNQLTQLNINADSRSPQASEILSAKSDINSAKLVIDTWQALPNTGTTLTDSKFVNVNITPLQTKVSSRTTVASTRNSQITTALGSVTQNGDGTFTGTGLYHDRFKQVDLRINLAGGPLTEYYEKGMADSALAQIVNTATGTADTYNSSLRTEKLTQNADGTNKVYVVSTTGFSASNTVYVVADNLTELTGTITSLDTTSITLNITIPNTYTSALRARIYKQL